MFEILMIGAVAGFLALLWVARTTRGRSRHKHLCRLFDLDPAEWRLVRDDLGRRRREWPPALINRDVAGEPDALFVHRRQRRVLVGELKSRRWRGSLTWAELYQVVLYTGLARQRYKRQASALVRFNDHLVELAHEPSIFEALADLVGECRRVKAGRRPPDGRPLFERGRHIPEKPPVSVERTASLNVRPFLIAGALAMALACPASAQDRSPLEGRAVQSITDADIESMESVPVDGLDRVTLEDGRVYYLSKNKRFLFLGEMVDLWTGESVSGLETFDRVDFSRTGMTPPDFTISMGGEGPRWVLFVAPSCKTCREAFETAHERAKAGEIELLVAPIWRNDAEHRRVVSVWCGERLSDRLASVMKHTRTENPASCTDRQAKGQAASAMAFAHAFQIPALPAAISPDDRLMAGAALTDSDTYRERTEDAP